MTALHKTAVAATAIALLGCAEKPQTLDADLARDIALASEVQQQSVLVPQDTALSVEPESRGTSSSRTEVRTPTKTAPPPTRRAAPTTTASTPAPRTEQPVRAIEPEAEPAPAPAPSRARGILAGTSFGLTTRTQVCTNGNRPGDKIVATITEAVRGEGGAYIPAGSSVVLEVTSVTPGDTPESAEIAFRIRSIIIEDEARGVDASVSVVSDLQRTEVAREGSSDRKKVIGGAIAGALIGQVIGKDTKSTVIGAAAGAAAGTAAAAASKKYDACLPAGSEVRVTTTQPITLAG